MDKIAGKIPWWAIAATTVSTAGNALAALVPIRSLLQIAPGTGVRLMAEAGIMFIISGVTLFVALPLAIVSFRRERRWLFGMIAICLAMTPFFFSRWVMWHFADMRGITLEP